MSKIIEKNFDNFEGQTFIFIHFKTLKKICLCLLIVVINLF